MKMNRKSIKSSLNSTRDFIIGDVFKRNTFPSFLIAGTQKSGTTALSYYLSQHQDLQRAYQKEVGYFTTKKYLYGENWYRKQFPARIRKVKYFEATPDYIYFPSFARKLYKHNKNIKMIIVLRDPIKRAYSAWNMFKGIHSLPEIKKNKVLFNLLKYGLEEHGSEHFIDFMWNEKYPDFSSYISTELKMIGDNSAPMVPGFIRYGIYHEQIDRLLRYFNLNQILFIGNKELKNDRVTTLKRILDFVEIDNSIDKIKFKDKIGVRRYAEQMKKEDKRILSNFYKPHNTKLFKLISQNYDWG